MPDGPKGERGAALLRLEFDVEIAPNVGRSMHTDAKRLQLNVLGE